MSRMDKLIEGLAILNKYLHSTAAAEHDIIYAGPRSVGNVSTEDAARLEELGWFIEEDIDC